MIKDTEFFNKESAQYSVKRYPAKARTYVQSFFKRRLAYLMDMLSKRVSGKSGLSLLEVGCADGVVLREIAVKLGDSFSTMVGTDISEGMIDVAKSISPDPRILYYVRGKEPSSTYDVVIEVGVANYTDFDAELAAAAAVMKPGGVFLLSIAGTGSLNDKFGRGVGYNNFLSYNEYESRIRTKFDIEDSRAVGLFIPLIWMIPWLARAIQPALETLFAPILPGLFHEKVYVLKIRKR